MEKSEQRSFGSPDEVREFPHGRAEILKSNDALAGEALAPIAERLVALVREGEDPDVGRLRPFELAERWGVDRRDVVTVCLHGVSAGLLDLVWDLVCPSCRTASERMASLADAAAEGHCRMCEISFGVESQQAIEATFRPAPA